MEVSLVEQNILKDLRDCRPFEEVRVIKDKLGKYDSYLLVSSQKKIYRPDSP